MKIRFSEVPVKESDTQLTFLEGFAYLTSLAYFENPSNRNYSVMKTFASYMAKVWRLFDFMHFLVHVAKRFKEVFPCEQ